MFSILHISDLHRSRDEPLDNDSLIAALLADRDRYLRETPGVPAPSAIVVSGDIIQGAVIGQKNWQDSIRDQYEVANKFFVHLTERFLNGDRRNLIVVPGNHDVCWNTAFASMIKVPEDEYPGDLKRALSQPNTDFRWSWKERALYKIVDRDMYARRMDAYWKFFGDFYADVPLLKSINPKRGYQLFELQERKIVVAAFDSISGNDCFGASGAIAPGAIGRCALDLRDLSRSYGLAIAVWHHSIQGPPARDDYMDVGQVHEMIGMRFQLGMHGHQHSAAATTHYVNFGENQSMAVTSAGSLCAGSRELPRGINRQYNVVVIDDDLCHARVHVREMVEGEQFSRKRGGAFSEGFAELSWQPARDLFDRAIDSKEKNVRDAILRAETELHSGNASMALDYLREVDFSESPYGRSIAIQAAHQLEDWCRLISLLEPNPASANEVVMLVNAHLRINSLDRAEKILGASLDLDPGVRQELVESIRVKRMIKGGH